MMHKLLILSVFLSVFVCAVPSRQDDCDVYTITGVSGGFTKRINIDFSSSKAGDDVVSLLNGNGISISDYTVTGTGGLLSHVFTPANVYLADGSLEMKVSAYDGSGIVQSAEIVTDDTFVFASVRLTLKSSTTPGIAEGNFFYYNDTQETDWEILTTTMLTPSSALPAGIWATNQNVNGGASTTQVVPLSFDPSVDYHTYRIDWFDSTYFYVDDVREVEHSENVLTQAAHWIGNSWSNGDITWSNGPPTTDSITHIQEIDLYYGFSATATGTACDIDL